MHDGRVVEGKHEGKASCKAGKAKQGKADDVESGGNARLEYERQHAGYWLQRGNLERLAWNAGNGKAGKVPRQGTRRCRPAEREFRNKARRRARQAWLAERRRQAGRSQCCR